MSLASRKRVDKIYPSGRCLIENVPSYNMVKYAHCLPRTTKAVILTRLERSWEMPPRSLNLDSRRNIIRLGAVKHGLFDKNAWILLPEDHIIQLYFNAKDNPDQFPTLDNEFYRYRFIPHPAMKGSLIHRQNAVEQSGEIIVAAYSTTYSFPFTHLGLIESHLHPKFVIARTGQALEKVSLFLNYYDAHPALQAAMRNITETYLAWTRKLGESTSGEEDGFNDQDGDEESNSVATRPRRARQVKKASRYQGPSARKQDEEEDEESNSVATRPRRARQVKKASRYRGPSARKRDEDEDEDEESNSVATRPRRARQVKKAPGYQGPSARKRQRKEQTDGLWLDGETLREFNKEMPPKQARQRKMVAVQHWLSGLEPDSDNNVV